MARRDEEEFTAWVQEKERELIRAARAICFDVQNAEDVLQEALADIFPRWKKLKEHENLEAYVIRVMVSKHADIRRKYARRKAENEVSLELVATLLQTSDNSEKTFLSVNSPKIIDGKLDYHDCYPEEQLIYEHLLNLS